MIFVSFCTPTFNRRHTLHRVFESLRTQTFKSFEWVVSDDGSSDATKELIEEYRQVADFPIKYLYQENRGKHVAVNRAVEAAEGQFILIADSDDGFIPETAQVYHDLWNSLDENQKNKFSGALACAQDQNGKRYSNFLPSDPFDSTMHELYYIHKFRKESWCMFKRELHLKYMFKEDHIGYHPEGIIWKKISKNNPIRCTNKAVRKYYIEDTEQSIMRGNRDVYSKANTAVLAATNVLQNDFQYFWNLPKHFCLRSVQLFSYGMIKGDLWQILSNLNRRPLLLTLVLSPLSVLAFFYLKWNARK